MSATAATVTRPSVGRRRSPIWEHFKAAENAHGKRVAECLFCERIMKSQPDRMENHLIKLCPRVSDETRGQWLLARANRAAPAPSPEQPRECDADAAPALDQKRELESTGDATCAAGTPSSSVDVPVAEGVVNHPAQDSNARAQRQSESALTASVEPAEGASSFIAAAAAPSPETNKTRKSPPSTSASATKKPKLTIVSASDALEQPPHASANGTATHSEPTPCSCSCSAELQRRRLEFEERKGVLELESMRYDNDMKRIKLAEENMLARKRLQDAGVPYADIELLLPLRR